MRERTTQARSTADLAQWQTRIFATAWVTYFAYYLCRLNMTVAKTPFSKTFGWSSADFGKVFSALTICYAVGQFVNGQLADRFGTRIVSTIGVFGSVAMNIAVYILAVTASPADRESVLTWLLVIWGANGFFQAMGWSPMVRVMAHWFPLSRRGRVMGLFGTCYQFGAATSDLLATFLTGFYVLRMGGDWRIVFLVPSALFAAIGVGFFFFIRDDPAEVGLPPLASDEKAPTQKGAASRSTIWQNILATVANPYLWIVALTFFLLDANRYGFVNWMPSYIDHHASASASPLLKDLKKITTLGIHPVAGSLGAFTAGWATDRFFGGRRAPVIAILLALLGLSSIGFARIDPTNTPLVIAAVALVGFCTYGPHILMVGHWAQDFGKRKGAAGAAGFIDAVGYVGASLAGWGAGKLIDAHGYGPTFTVFGLAALVGACTACLLWKRGPAEGPAGDAATAASISRTSPAGAAPPPTGS
jgi:OPA family glycerol-3-phosphate transporter-like MFS transporter